MPRTAPRIRSATTSYASRGHAATKARVRRTCTAMMAQSPRAAASVSWTAIAGRRRWTRASTTTAGAQTTSLSRTTTRPVCLPTVARSSAFSFRRPAASAAPSDPALLERLLTPKADHAHGALSIPRRHRPRRSGPEVPRVRSGARGAGRQTRTAGRAWSLPRRPERVGGGVGGPASVPGASRWSAR